jgi:hypothetical protein
MAATDIEKSEFSLFLFTLAVHLRKDNYLMEFFLQETEKVNPTDSTKRVVEFLPLKGLLQRYKDDGISGEKSKEGILLFLQIDSEVLVDNIWRVFNLSNLLVMMKLVL